MKYFVMLIVGLALGYLIFRPAEPKPVAVAPAPAPAPVPRPPPTPVEGRSLATVINLAFMEIYGPADNDPLCVAHAGDDLRAVRSKLPAASDAYDPVKMKTAQQLCALLQQAVDMTVASLAEEKRNSSIRATSLTKEGGAQVDPYFASLREQKWLAAFNGMRSQATAIFASLGAPGPMTYEEQQALDRNSLPRYAKTIQFRVTESLSRGVLGAEYAKAELTNPSLHTSANATPEMQPTGRIIYIEGMPAGAAVGHQSHVVAYRDGFFQDGSRTFEKWIFVR